MRRALFAEQMRRVDQAASEQFGIPSAILMENAGRLLMEEALRLAGPGARFLVLCGGGNNGGDGLVTARLLHLRGHTVFAELLASPENLKGDPLRNYQALLSCGLKPVPIPLEVPFGENDVVVDALFGTGLSRPPEGVWAEAIGRIAGWRKLGAKVLCADVPSGLDADRGQPYPACVQGDRTLALGHLKVGHVLEPGASVCGEVQVIDIGIPPLASQDVPREQAVFLVEEDDVREKLPPRAQNSHKGSYGHVLVVAGSAGKTGAAALAAMGALRGGAGRVTVAARPEALAAILAFAPEVMGVPLPAEGPLGPSDLNALLDASDDKQAVVFGPGIHRGEDTAKLLGAFLEELAVPCVLDADGLNAVAAAPDLLGRAKGPLLLTPHPGEMATLLGIGGAQVQADRVAAVRQLATQHHLVVVLKGSRSLVCNEDGTTFVNPTGNPGMATAGTGDVLAGLCGALLAQGLSCEDAALLGVYAHGRAGDEMARQTGQLGLVASDLFEGLSRVWVAWGR